MWSESRIGVPMMNVGWDDGFSDGFSESKIQLYALIGHHQKKTYLGKQTRLEPINWPRKA